MRVQAIGPSAITSNAGGMWKAPSRSAVSAHEDGLGLDAAAAAARDDAAVLRRPRALPALGELSCGVAERALRHVAHATELRCGPRRLLLPRDHPPHARRRR